MELKTKIINSFDHPRKLRWAGKSGVSIGPREEKVLEGLYPSACHTEKQEQMFKREYEKGYFKAVLITDMSVNRVKQSDYIKDNINYVIKNQEAK